MNHSLRKHWKVTSALLLQAREILYGCNGSTKSIEDAEFEAYLRNNEFGPSRM